MRLKDTGLTAQELKDMVNKYMVETYERYDFIAERAEGMYLYDEEGNAYLDFYGGVAVNSCGNRNPKVIAAIKDQLDDIMHTFNYPYTIPQALLAKKICDTIGMDKITQELLETVGLPDKAKAYPAQLSGGQQQRVAIARALATNPKVLLCDEATSALDPKTTRQILELIGDINKKLGITVVIITHQMSVVKSVCNHVAILDDGEVVEDGLVSTVFSAPKSAAARHLVFPGGADVTVSDPAQERRIRLIFRSAKTTSIPLVARLATEENIAANVISASTQKLSEEIYGSMLLGVPAAQFDRAWEFLSGIENLQVEEASVGVQ